MILISQTQTIPYTMIILSTIILKSRGLFHCYSDFVRTVRCKFTWHKLNCLYMRHRTSRADVEIRLVNPRLSYMLFYWVGYFDGGTVVNISTNIEINPKKNSKKLYRIFCPCRKYSSKRLSLTQQLDNWKLGDYKKPQVTREER